MSWQPPLSIWQWSNSLPMAFQAAHSQKGIGPFISTAVFALSLYQLFPWQRTVGGLLSGGFGLGDLSMAGCNSAGAAWNWSWVGGAIAGFVFGTVVGGVIIIAAKAILVTTQSGVDVTLLMFKEALLTMFFQGCKEQQWRCLCNWLLFDYTSARPQCHTFLLSYHSCYTNEYTPINLSHDLPWPSPLHQQCGAGQQQSFTCLKQQTGASTEQEWQQYVSTRIIKKFVKNLQPATKSRKDSSSLSN